MPPRFDPVARRRSWLDFFIDFEARSDPDSVHPRALGHYASCKAGSLVGAYLVGLADEVRPIVEKLTMWMETQPGPNVRFFTGEEQMTFSWPFALYQWHQALGLFKWLARGEGAQCQFAKAVDAAWAAWEQAKPQHPATSRAVLRQLLSEYLATALTGDAPAPGLKLYQASAIKQPSGRSGPARGFGEWACQHLAAGGVRDQAFIERGAKMLTKTLLFRFSWYGVGIEPALWLKAIYFDSGLVQSPEEAIARAYDSLPGIDRPYFVRG
jgi:hypothetical protein